MCRFLRLLSAAGAIVLLVLAVVVGATPAQARDPKPTQASLELVRADKPTLDALFAGGTAHAMPLGFAPGRTILSPGSRNVVRKSHVTGLFWQGKVFRDDGTMINKVFGMRAITADWYLGDSLRDGQPAIVIDYSRSPKLFRGVRDEIREVSPGMYLGVTYITRENGPEPVAMFTLEPQGR